MCVLCSVFVFCSVVMGERGMLRLVGLSCCLIILFW